MTGYAQPKEEWSADIESRAAFMNQNIVDARIWGSRNTWRLQQNMQLEKRGGKRVILNSLASTF